MEKCPDEIEDLLLDVLDQAFIQEVVNLDGLLQDEREAAAAEVEAKVVKNRQHLLERIEAAYEKEFEDLLHREFLSGSDIRREKEELEARHENERQAFNNLTTLLALDAKNMLQQDLDTSKKHEMLGLRKKQLRLLYEFMDEVLHDEGKTKKYADKLAQAKEEYQRFYDENVVKMHHGQQQRLKEEEQLQDERSKRLAKRLRCVHVEVLDEEKNLYKQEEDKLKASEQQRKLQVLFSEEAGQNHGEREKALEEQLRSERKQQLGEVKARLDIWRDARLVALRIQAEKDVILEQEADVRLEIMKRLQDGDFTEKNLLESVQKEMKLIQKVQAPSNKETEWSGFLLSSPLFKQLSHIEEHVGKSFALDDKGHTSGVHITDEHLHTTKGDQLTPVELDHLSPSTFVVYQYGVNIMRLLQKAAGAPVVEILIASNLPRNNFTRNAFRNSFFYQYSGNILWVRQQCLDSVGDFVLLVLHCLAHIKAGDFVDDSHTRFLRNFYKYLQVVCNEMFQLKRANMVETGPMLHADVFKSGLSHMTPKVNVQKYKFHLGTWLSGISNVAVSSCPSSSDAGVVALRKALQLKQQKVESTKSSEFKIGRTTEPCGQQKAFLQRKQDILNEELSKVFCDELTLTETLKDLERYPKKDGAEKLKKIKRQVMLVQRRKCDLSGQIKCLQELIEEKNARH
ncbi:uncharacterized protein LOC135488075 [Lineus longissimus]|uniref:uncharacterized protein LOC135488075 n=1 Tax=Lineus longissimus TaxID=88925 RepID=UPI00315C8FCF